MKRCRASTLTAASTLSVAIYLVSAGSAFGATAGAGKLGLDDPVCASHVSLCADSYGGIDGYYVGHDEPSLEFKSNVPGSGNNMTYVMTLPRDPKTQPTAFGGLTTPTWNFQLRPTFWFGLTLCDSESAPEYTKTCTPDSDSNNLVGTNPNSANYIGKHPGNAFMELQFDGPGYVPQFEGFGCDAHPLLRGADDRQPHRKPEHTALPDERDRDRGLQQLHPRRRRAHQLGLHHQERPLPGAREPAVHRNVLEPKLQRGQPGSRPRIC